ncbi:MAG: DUF167 domain-containing protein [Patescibacteria group bacterium]
MRIFVKAKPDDWEERVEKIDDTHFVVSVKEPPIKGQANYAIIKVLAKYFGVEKYRLKIIFGYTSKNKIIEIL